MDKLGLNFGQVIAFLIPGILGVYALAGRIDTVKALLGGDNRVPATEALIPLLLLALAIGIVINAISWAVIRPLIAFFGVKLSEYPELKKENLGIYNAIIESTFRYHQFYSNMLVAILLLGPLWIVKPLMLNSLRNISFPVVSVILFLAARHSLESTRNSLNKLQLKERIELKADSNPDRQPDSNPGLSDKKMRKKEDLRA